ncbi:ATP-binding protein [Roseisolibacter agri]|uniref:ATP-binding protein n=1 Tax=Roseisolibacter agri TaxID=2014610 RepID=UPI0024E0AB38|nr:ATP-binding protein [Roseisolibacter agri]
MPAPSAPPMAPDVEVALARSEERFRLATRAIGGFVYDWDARTGRVEWTGGLLETIGVAPSEADPTIDWWHGRVHPDDAARVGADGHVDLLHDPTRTSYEFEYRVRHRDGRWLWVADRMHVVRDTEGRPVRAVGGVTDVTARRAAEAAGAARARRLDRLRELGAALARMLTVSEVARAVLPRAVAAASATVALLLLRTADDPDLLEAVNGVGGAAHLAAGWRLPIASSLAVARAVREGVPVWGDARDAAPAADEARALAAATGASAWVALPLRVDGRVLGTLALGYPAAPEVDDERREFLMGFADQCALAVARSRLVEAERAARARAERALAHTQRLQRLTAELARVPTPQEVAEVVLREGTAAVGAATGSVSLLGPDGDTMTTVASIGWAGRGLWERYSLAASGSPGLEALRSRVPVFVATPQELAARFPAAAASAAAAGLQATAVLPLAIGGRAQGYVSLSWSAPHAVTDEERALLEAIAAQGAQALERARLLEAERVARAEADAANRAKSDFLATMSHELRTPINAALGYAELMALEVHGPVTPAQGDALARIRRSQLALLSRINDVLSFAKLEARRVSFDLQPLDVAQLLADVEPLVAPQVAAKAQAFAITPLVQPLHAQADAERVSQILLNLVSNAVKFTPPGGRIALEASSLDEGRRVAIRVRDTGRGIPADRLESVFDPFVQVDATLTREQGGTGLGLAISRELARGMGGDLTVESVPGEGSTFTLTLPRGERRNHAAHA